MYTNVIFVVNVNKLFNKKLLSKIHKNINYSILFFDRFNVIFLSLLLESINLIPNVKQISRNSLR